MADLSLRGISKRFGRETVIDNVSLEIADGAFVVLVGPSGCGKSTLLRLIAGLEAPNSGEIRIGGEVVNEWEPRERGIAMVFQSYALYPHMSVYDNIAFGLSRLSMPRQDLRRRVEKTADRLQIGHLLERKPRELSGGQRQRVAIGRAIVREPRAFLFDEPLSNLDAALRMQMRLEFMNLHRELGTTIVYVTHDQAEAMTLASTIVVLRQGRIEQVGPPLDVYERPCNRFVASFIGSPSMNMISGRIESCREDVARVALDVGASLSVDIDARRGGAGRSVVLGVRPEHVREAASDGPLQATIVAVERLGGESLLHAKLASGEMITMRAAADSTARNGDSIRLEVDTDRCHLFDEDGKAFSRCAHSQA